MPDRAALLTELAGEMTAAGDSVPGDWDRFALVAEITALGVRVTGFRYLGDGPGLPMLMDTSVIETVARLREASPGEDGRLFDIYVARLNRADAAVDDQSFTAAEGRGYRVTASAVGLVADRVRPGVPLVAALPQPPPATETDGAEPATGSQEPAPAQHGPVDSGSPAPPESGPDALEPDGAEPGRGEPAAGPKPGEPVDSAAAALGALSATVAAWPELAGDDWDGYGAVAVLPLDDDRPATTMGVRHLADGPAIPTLIGGSFLTDLRALRDAAPDEQGQRAGAVLLRLVRDQGPVAVRFVYDPAAVAVMTWDGVDPVVADRLRLVPRSADVPALMPRPSADQLDDRALRARIESDLLASVHTRDRWSAFALGADLVRSRAAAGLYDGHGVPTAFRPPLSPLGDLAALRSRNGAGWTGVVATIRSGTDTVDLRLMEPGEIERYLSAGPSEALESLRPESLPASS